MIAESPDTEIDGVRVDGLRMDAIKKITEATLRFDGDSPTVTDICREAGITRDTYYQATADSSYEPVLRGIIRETMGGVIPLARQVWANAQLPGKNGAADRLLAAKLMNLLPSEKISVQADIVVRHGTIPDAQMYWLYQQGCVPRSMWIPSIVQAVDEGRLSPEPCPSLLGAPAQQES